MLQTAAAAVAPTAPLSSCSGGGGGPPTPCVDPARLRRWRRSSMSRRGPRRQQRHGQLRRRQLGLPRAMTSAVAPLPHYTLLSRRPRLPPPLLPPAAAAAREAAAASPTTQPPWLLSACMPGRLSCEPARLRWPPRPLRPPPCPAPLCPRSTLPALGASGLCHATQRRRLLLRVGRINDSGCSVARVSSSRDPAVGVGRKTRLTTQPRVTRPRPPLQLMALLLPLQ